MDESKTELTYVVVLETKDSLDTILTTASADEVGCFLRENELLVGLECLTRDDFGSEHVYFVTVGEERNV